MDREGITSTADMDAIKAYIVNSTPIPVSVENAEIFDRLGESYSPGGLSNKGFSFGKPTIHQNISLSSFAALNTLEDIIPNGFILLHEDLADLLEAMQGSGGKSGGSSWFSNFSATTAGAAAGGFVSGLFNGFSDNTNEHFESIIDDLNSDLTADDFRDNAEITAIQKDAFTRYLKAYYNEQIYALQGEAIGTGVGKGVGSALSETVTETLTGIFIDGPKKIWEKLTGKEDYYDNLSGSLGELVKVLDQEFTIDTLKADEDVMDEILAIQKESVVSYLKAYYNGQIIDLYSEAAGDAVGNVVGGAVSGLFGGLIEGTLGKVVEIFSDKKNEKTATSLGEIAEELTASIDVEKFKTDDEILEIQDDSVKAYLKAYYNAQILELAADSVGDSVNSVVEGAVSGYWGGLIEGTLGKVVEIFTGKRNEETATGLAKIAEELTEEIDVEKFKDDEEVLAIQDESVKAYLKAYYNAQIMELASDSVGESIGNVVGGAVGGAVGGFFSGLIQGTFGTFIDLFRGSDGKTNEKEATKLWEIAEEITDNIKASDYINDSEILELQKKSIVEYLKLYYEQINEQFSTQNRADLIEEGWSSKITAGMKGIWNGVIGFFTGGSDSDALSPEQQEFVDKINEVITELNRDFSIAEAKSDDGVKQVQLDFVKNFLQTYYEGLAEMIATQTDYELYSSGNLNAMTTSVMNASTTFIGRVGSVISGSVSDSSKWLEDSAVQKIRSDAMKTMLKDILAIENKAVKDKYKSKIDKNTIDSYFSGFSASYVAKAAETLNQVDLNAAASSEMSADSNNLRIISNNVAIINNRVARAVDLLTSIDEKTLGNVIIDNSSTNTAVTGTEDGRLAEA